MTTGTAIDVHGSRSGSTGTSADALFSIIPNVFIEHCREFRPIKSGRDDTSTAARYYGGDFGSGNTPQFIGYRNPEPAELRDYECVNFIKNVENLANPIASITSAAIEAMMAFSADQRSPGWIWGALALGAGYGIWRHQNARKADDRAQLPRELRERLDKLSNLPENWNSYGAPRVDQTALRKTRAILRQVYSNFANAPTPFVAPGSDGGLGIEFIADSGNELLVDVYPDGRVTFLLGLVDGDTQSEEEIEGQMVSEYEITALLGRIVG